MASDPRPTNGHFPLDHISVPEDVHRVWEDVVDFLSEYYRVPAALIMRAHEREIEVLACNRNGKHPYRRGLREPLAGRLYCEEVMRSRSPLLVTDARHNPRWRDNPDALRGMISYLGIPLTWPDGGIFGTICMLDRKKNRFSDQPVILLEKFAHLVMADLHVIHSNLRIRHAHQKLAGLHEEMKRFMGIAAHDMRNSLNVLLGCCKHLLPRGEGLTRRQLTYLDMINKSASTLLQLMDELMDIAKVEGMHLPLHLEEVALETLINENIKFNQHLADAKGIQINLVLPTEDIRVRADPGKLDQVLNNLLSNAVKFSPQNSTIQVTVDADLEDIVVSIHDQGPGIPKNEQTGLFSPFQTTSIRPTSGETSTGLGLYIARRIVEEHGGNIWVESEPGKGSRFCFILKRKTVLQEATHRQDDSPGPPRP